jgi:hypothetical protein
VNRNELSHRHFQLLDSLHVYFEIATLLVLHEEPPAFFLHVFNNEPAAHLISEPGVATPRELVTDDASSQPERETVLICPEHSAPQSAPGSTFFAPQSTFLLPEQNSAPEHFFGSGILFARSVAVQNTHTVHRKRRDTSSK